MDLTLSPEQEAVRKSAREWVDEVVVPRALTNDREERFPQEAFEGLKSGGWLGMSIPSAYGGGGADPLSYALFIEELGRGDGNVRSIVTVHLGLVAGSIARWGTEEQKQLWLPRMATGDVLGCFCLTEPDHGSDPASLQSSAVRDGDGWRINGNKIFITNGGIAGVAMVMARTGGPGAKGVSAFLVPTDAPGFSATPIHGKLGLRSCDTAAITLEDVRVGADALLGEEGKGIRIALSALDDGRFGLAAACTGLAQACLDQMVEYSTQRRQFGKPIAAFQLVQEMIADTAVEVSAARLLVWQIADRKQQGLGHTLESSMAKYFASETAVRAANNAVQVHGGYGYIDEFPVGKFLRDARVTTLYEGTSQIQKLLIGRALTGESAFL
ncbi:MAG TPA: acyl-CoA dehydrogenase family protein [Mycobacteriales bacterium]|nr:acyl-CoA dehydrogenase family protein [Mycobacteriales bacterium]